MSRLFYKALYHYVRSTRDSRISG